MLNKWRATRGMSFSEARRWFHIPPTTENARTFLRDELEAY